MSPAYGAGGYGSAPYGDPVITFPQPVSTLTAAPTLARPIRVYAYDLNVGSLISELSVTGLNYSARINDAGAFGFYLALADPTGPPINQLILAYGGAPFKVIIDQGGVILYSGIAWTTNYSSDTKQLDVTGKGLMSFFDAQTISRDYSAVTYPAGIAQTALVQKAVNDCQVDRPAANIGVNAAVQASSNLPQTTIVPGYAFRSYPMVAQVLSDVTAAVTPGSGGVDYFIRDVYSNQGVPTHICVIQTPRCGLPAGQSGLVVDLSRVIGYTWPTESSLSGNQVIAVGTGTGNKQLVSVQSSGIAVGGLGQPPLMQAVLSYNNINSASQLAATARGAVHNIGRGSIATPTVTMPVDYPGAALGSFSIGDDIRVHCPPQTDPRFWGGLDQFWRIVAYAVTVADEGVSTMQFTLNPPPIY